MNRARLSSKRLPLTTDAGGYCHHDHYYRQPKCSCCGGLGEVPAMIDTPTGAAPCPYIYEPCPVCGPGIQPPEHVWPDGKTYEQLVDEEYRRFLNMTMKPYQMQPEHLRKACTDSNPINWGAEIDDLYQRAIS